MKGKAGEHDKVYKQMGNRLRTLRKAAGFTSIFAFSIEVEMTPSHYAGYERGTNMKMSTLLDILKKLNVTLTEFFSEGFD